MNGLRFSGRLMAIVVLCAFSLFARSAETSLPPAQDLAAEATAAAEQGMPLIVMISLPGCPYCEVIRRSHLLPLQNVTATGGKPQIRQVEINGANIMRDFDGSEITHRAFSQRLKVKIAPVVFFFNAKGEQVATPLMGAMIADFYGAYLDAALSEAKNKIRSTKPANP